MLRIFIMLSGFFILLTCLSARAADISSTIVNPNTQETTTTTVNPATQETTVTKSNPMTGETSTTIITPAPAPQETVVAPQGFVNCFTVDAGWYRNLWIPAHRVCRYEGSSFAGSTWIEGYWVCSKYRVSQGICTKWEWTAAHWEKTLEVY